MSDHSPTPWLREDLTIYALEDVPGKWVRGEPAKRNRFWANVHGNAPREELEAVARKMHAAPDLLEACVALIRSDDLQRAIDLARAAIAKAEGNP